MPERAPERFLVATEACGSGTPDLSSIMEVLGYVCIYGCKGYVGGASRGPTRQGRALGGAYPREHLVAFLMGGPSLLDLI